MFPKDIEETRVKINSAFGSISYGLSEALKAASLSGEPNLLLHIGVLYTDTFNQMRVIGEYLGMQGWKPPKE